MKTMITIEILVEMGLTEAEARAFIKEWNS